jgi:hypothetical protein
LILDIRQKKEEMGIEIVYINERNNNIENKPGILYNDTVDQLKGM